MRNKGVYRCPDDITNFKFRVRLKEVGDVKGSKSDTDAEEYRVADFKWQEKKFGKVEVEFYADLSNCLTDLDKKYHEAVANLQGNKGETGLIYSYVDEDNFDVAEDKVVSSRKPSILVNKLSNLQIRDLEAPEEFDYEESLKSAIGNPVFGQEFVKMFIVADFGEYYENTWIKREYVLCMLKYCQKKKLLLLTPDFNRIKPYFLEINGDELKTFKYYIENLSDNIPPELLLKENDILNKVKLHNLKLKARKVGEDFELCPKQKLNVHLFVEILCGSNFENSNVYVQYYLDLPETWTSIDGNLHGSTHSSVVKRTSAFFGFPFEMCLQCNIQDLDNANKSFPANPRIYFEVISKDSWARFRAEGVAYLTLPIFQPGKYESNIRCVRIKPKSLYSNLKRFFIGDYMSHNDITWFGRPSDHQGEVINKYGVCTANCGELTVRTNVIHHSQALVRDANREDDREKFLLEKLNASGLIKSVEQVLKAFREARKRMLEVRCKT